MDQKYFWIVGIIIIILGIGMAFTFISAEKHSHELDLALSPYAVFEGTVISLSLDNETYQNGSSLEIVPNDTALIKIDKIIRTGGSNFNWTSIGLEEGREVSVGFTYTARPARIIRVQSGTWQNNQTVSHSIIPTNITFENGYFVFKINGHYNKEKILPGLKVGSKFKAKVWNTYEFKIAEYEIIN
ncbi:hypothetical protein [Methanobacterium alcaliphilum]|uniref:hypothetical protein n=1 Tax=Methanobacterium alcaliphilum TaxID=392018 RepID=UPI00200AAF6D|nr:hypothetical protein [Methanobacterium alcaliphilum]MCK9150409.1 hypothetical protein [Methanobacterium alcaliphilum]